MARVRLMVGYPPVSESSVPSTLGALGATFESEAVVSRPMTQSRDGRLSVGWHEVLLHRCVRRSSIVGSSSTQVRWVRITALVTSRKPAHVTRDHALGSSCLFGSARLAMLWGVTERSELIQHD
jgi:hypothetical protein